MFEYIDITHIYIYIYIYMLPPTKNMFWHCGKGDKTNTAETCACNFKCWEKIQWWLVVYLLARARVIFVKERLIEIIKLSSFVLLTDFYRNLTEGEAMTIKKFSGISFGDAKLKPFDCSEFDVIIFDKIHFSNLDIYWRIKQFVGQNKQNKILIATGDCK